jgi:hypothetical protein
MFPNSIFSCFEITDQDNCHSHVRVDTGEMRMNRDQFMDPVLNKFCLFPSDLSRSSGNIVTAYQDSITNGHPYSHPSPFYNLQVHESEVFDNLNHDFLAPKLTRFRRVTF